MHPIFWEINSMITIRWYGVMVALGFLAAMFLIDYNKKYAGMNRDQATTLVFIGVIAGVIGSRIAYVIQFFDQYRHNLLEIFRIDRGGLVFYGGFFLAIFCMILYCRKTRLDTWRVLDVCTPALAFGHMFGRIGCFLNGCCFGKPTELYWGVVHPQGSMPARVHGCTAIHPVQLYEAGANLLLGVAMYYILRKTRRGVATSLYLLIYGIIRFVDEFFRGDHADYLAGGFTRAQMIGLLLIPAALIMLIYFVKYGNKNSTTDGKPRV
jgi:phosphatidylglycerol:prolipoprotein diacylglycerol transferase